MPLTFIQRTIAHLTFFALLISGIVWLVFNFILDPTTPLRSLNVWSLRIHGLAVFGFLIVFGMLISTHISFNWRVKKNRRLSGIIISANFLLLIISGYLLYYSGNEELREFMSYLHWICGIIVTIPFVIHFIKKKKPARVTKSFS